MEEIEDLEIVPTVASDDIEQLLEDLCFLPSCWQN